jgi:voltage-dependent calcium channel L type alpha-1D
MYGKYFEGFIIFVIIVNAICMGLVYEGMTHKMDDALGKISTVCTVIFACEAILKITASGISGYYHNPWNRFDFVVVLTSMIDFFLDVYDAGGAALSGNEAKFIRVAKILRVLRLLRLIRKIRSLEQILMALIYSVPPMLNSLALILLSYFILSVLGVFLFKSVTTGMVIDEYNNFATFGSAMSTIYRTTTGENWPFFLYDTWHYYDCSSGQTCGTFFSIFYWIPQQIFCSLVLIQLFVLVSNKSLQDFHDENNPARLMGEILDDFRGKWANYSKASSGFHIPTKSITHFLRALNPPLGFRSEEKYLVVARDIYALNIFGDQPWLTFNETLYYAMKRSFGSFNKKSHKFLRAYIFLEELRTRHKIYQQSQKKRVLPQPTFINSN